MDDAKRTVVYLMVDGQYIFKRTSQGLPEISLRDVSASGTEIRNCDVVIAMEIIPGQSVSITALKYRGTIDFHRTVEK